MRVFHILYGAQPFLNAHTGLSNCSFFLGGVAYLKFQDFATSHVAAVEDVIVSCGPLFTTNGAKVVSFTVMTSLLISGFAPHCFFIHARQSACKWPMLQRANVSMPAGHGSFHRGECLRSALLLSLQMATALQSGTALSAGPQVLRVNWYPLRVQTTSMTSTTKVRPLRGPVWEKPMSSSGEMLVSNKVIAMYLSVTAL